MTTCEQPANGGVHNPDPALTLWQVGSHVSRSVRRVLDARKRTPGGSGRRWPKSSDPFNRLGSSEKTCPVCSPAVSSTLFATSDDSDTEPEWELSQLVRWVPHTHATECSYWLTPKASDATSGALSLDSPESVERLNRRSQKAGAFSLNDQLGGRGNPEWIEWLMGFPIGWTDSMPSETQ